MTVPHHLFVCTSCRVSDEAREPRDRRAGARLFAHLVEQFAKWAKREGFVIVAYDCLSVCAHPCGVALRAPVKFTYGLSVLLLGFAILVRSTSGSGS